MFDKNLFVTCEEWHKLPDGIILRLLNNYPFVIVHQIQEIYDIISLMVAHRPDLLFSDKFNKIEKQLRIVSLETKELERNILELIHSLRPKEFSPEK